MNIDAIRERWEKWLQAEREGGDWFAPYPVDLVLVDDTLAHIDALEARLENAEAENQRLRGIMEHWGGQP